MPNRKARAKRIQLRGLKQDWLNTTRRNLRIDFTVIKMSQALIWFDLGYSQHEQGWAEFHRCPMAKCPLPSLNFRCVSALEVPEGEGLTAPDHPCRRYISGSRGLQDNYRPALGREESIKPGWGEVPVAPRRPQTMKKEKQQHHVSPSTRILLLPVRTSGCQRGRFNFPLPDFARGGMEHRL